MPELNLGAVDRGARSLRLVLSDPASSTLMVDHDKRSARRLRTLLAAKIILGRGTSVVDCAIRDLSASGARIRVDEVVLLPSTFDILIGAERRRERCRVVWRRPTDIGVVFER